MIFCFSASDKDKMRVLYGPTPTSEPVVSGLNDLRSVINKNIKDKLIAIPFFFISELTKRSL